MGLADIFVARDGDASIPGEIIAVTFIMAVLIGAAVWCWWRRRNRRRVWAAKLAETVETALTTRVMAMENREDIELLRADEDKMALVVGGVLESVLGELALDHPRHLRAVR